MNNEGDWLVAGSHVFTETGLYFNKLTTLKQIVIGLTSYDQFFRLEYIHLYLKPKTTKS